MSIPIASMAQIKKELSNKKHDVIMFQNKFMIDEKTGERRQVDCVFSFMNYGGTEDEESDTELGNRYNIFTLRKTPDDEYDVDCYTAIIGAVDHHVERYVKSGYDGMFVKRKICDGENFNFLRLVKGSLVLCGVPEEEAYGLMSKYNENAFNENRNLQQA